MKEEKIGLTTANWILSIAGIIVLLLLIILPPVFRAFLKEEKVEAEKKVVTIGELLCTKSGISTTDYTDSDAVILSYRDDKIESYIQRLERVYNDSVVYQASKMTYGKYVTAFAPVVGYDYSATPKDDTSTFMIVSKYDLKKFNSTTVEIEGEEGLTAVTNHPLLMNSMSATKNNFTNNGYTCEKSNEHQEELIVEPE